MSAQHATLSCGKLLNRRTTSTVDFLTQLDNAHQVVSSSNLADLKFPSAECSMRWQNVSTKIDTTKQSMLCSAGRTCLRNSDGTL